MTGIVNGESNGLVKPLTNVSGVFPSLAQVADYGPPRSEIGIGSLMPFNGYLYVQNYLSHTNASGSGTSLRRISPDMSMEIVSETRGCDGTYTNRFVHFPTGKLVLGPHVISPDHEITTVKQLRGHRLCGTSRHLTKAQTHVYVLSMEGIVFELNLTNLQCQQLFDLNEELTTEGEWKVHYKDCYTCFGRLVICSNEYGEDDWARKQSRGRLAEYDGEKWTLLARKPFTGLGGRHEFGGTIFASGWDQASAILDVFTDCDKKWTRYRLPKASHCFDHKWQTEWPRIREIEHERLLMDHHGMFYELSPWAYGGRIWGVRPISTHLWVLGDFCSWRGLFVGGGDNASPSDGLNPYTAEAQSGMMFIKTDDLWNFGKPTGWGGPWWQEDVKANVPSDPYLMTGFDKKCLHIENMKDRKVVVSLEIDLHGHGRFSKNVEIPVGPDATVTHVFPEGFSAHWVRLVSNTDSVLSAQIFYT